MNQLLSQQEWIKLTRKRLRQVGARASRLERLWSVASWVALVAGAAWFTNAWLRPIAQLDAVAPQPIKLVVPLARTALPIDDRQVALEALWSTNRFAADGLPWPQAALLSESLDGPGAVLGSTAKAGVQTKAISPGRAQATKPVTHEVEPEELPAEIKSALALLELRGVYADRALRPVAMVGFGPTRGGGVVRALREGESFAGHSEKEPLWRVESIDVASQLVMLSRSGVRTALSMYSLSRKQLPPEVEIAPSVPTVASASEHDILRALREGGVGAEDLAQLTKLMRAPTLLDEVEQEAAVASAGSALVDAITASPESGPRAGPPQMPAALRGLLEQMAAQSAGSKRRPDKRAEATDGEPD